LRAIRDGHFEVVMAVYNILNQSAEKELLPAALANRVGVVAMTAVRRALADRDVLSSRVAEAKAGGLLRQDALPTADPLDWLIHGEVKSLPHAAYAFAAEPDAVATVLTGTANPGHLAANVAAITGPPLPAPDRVRLRDVFGGLAEPLAE
jgi:aryl-alcohol dehydrogenase-like predicted oxidoreductase